MAATYSVLGDSISTIEGLIPEANKVYYEGDLCEQNDVIEPSDTWWMQVIDRREGTLLANGSFSGCLVAGKDFPAGCSSERARQILGNHGEEPDYILIYLGINDYGEGTPLPVFEQAYEHMLANLTAVAPQAEILCITLASGRSADHDVDFFRSKYKGESLEAYNNAIRRAAQKHGATLVDIAACGEAFDTLDGTHPTARGMRQLADMFFDAV